MDAEHFHYHGASVAKVANALVAIILILCVAGTPYDSISLMDDCHHHLRTLAEFVKSPSQGTGCGVPPSNHDVHHHRMQLVIIPEILVEEPTQEVGTELVAAIAGISPTLDGYPHRLLEENLLQLRDPTLPGTYLQRPFYAIQWVHEAFGNEELHLVESPREAVLSPLDTEAIQRTAEDDVSGRVERHPKEQVLQVERRARGGLATSNPRSERALHDLELLKRHLPGRAQQVSREHVGDQTTVRLPRGAVGDEDARAQEFAVQVPKGLALLVVFEVLGQDVPDAARIDQEVRRPAERREVGQPAAPRPMAELFRVLAAPFGPAIPVLQNMWKNADEGVRFRAGNPRFLGAKPEVQHHKKEGKHCCYWVEYYDVIKKYRTFLQQGKRRSHGEIISRGEGKAHTLGDGFGTTNCNCAAD
mmetsp:Transcript_12617/g.27220  ORF Transcript_12617/g.27220 Transcript_12617/m.27220 type:complete len:417 (-) Transcript_12617:99-1349(-)